MNISDYIGEQLRKIRRSNDFTLQRLSDETGISVAYLHLIERGKANVSLKKLELIKKSLDAEWYTFFPDETNIK